MVALGGLDCSPFSHSCPLPLPAHLLTPPPPPFPPLAQSNSNKRSRADGTNQIKDAASKWGAEFEALEEDDQFTYLDTLASLMGPEHLRYLQGRIQIDGDDDEEEEDFDEDGEEDDDEEEGDGEEEDD